MPPYRPQLATLVLEPPAGDSWLHEIKYDGFRFGAAITDGDVKLISRRGRDWTSTFPDVVAALRQLPVRSALLDGELAVVLPDGRTDFHSLQGASGHIPGLAYFLFDLMYLDGLDVTREQLEVRKQRLRNLLRGSPSVLRYSDHVIGNGAEVFEAATRLRTEGVISKLRNAPYRPGRGTDWLKTKVVQRHPFVVGGYLVSAGAPLAAMLAGYYDDAGEMVYAGKVGTGFQKIEQALLAKLRSMTTPTCPFTRASRPRGSDFREARWVRPELVADIEFLEWTPDGHFRHPTFKEVRHDVEPGSIRRIGASEADDR